MNDETLVWVGLNTNTVHGRARVYHAFEHCYQRQRVHGQRLATLRKYAVAAGLEPCTYCCEQT